jgi:hypothetical protein
MRTRGKRLGSGFGDAVRRRKLLGGGAGRTVEILSGGKQKIRGTAPIRGEILKDFPARRR